MRKNKTEIIKFRVTENQKRDIKFMADKQNMSISKYMLNRLAEKEDVVEVGKGVSEMTNEQLYTFYLCVSVIESDIEPIDKVAILENIIKEKK